MIGRRSGPHSVEMYSHRTDGFEICSPQNAGAPEFVNYFCRKR